jgi:hypothetical protein
MLSPSYLSSRVDTLFTKLALDGTLRLRSDALMRPEVFHSIDSLAFRAKLVL